MKFMLKLKDMGVPRKAPQNISGIEDCKVGHKYRATFELEVTSDKSPDEWDIREKKMKPTDRIVRFKATKGQIEKLGMNSNDKKPGSIAEARMMAKEGKEY